MAAAFGWGTLAASSLVIGALVALRFRISLRVIGLILAFGAGVLISAVAFDLVEEAVSKAHGHGAAIAGLFAGCAVFFGGDWLIDHFGGADRKDADGGQANGSALAIVLGTVLDGIPESMVIGLTIFQGGAVGAAYLTAVFISNLPESISSTSGLHRRLAEVADLVDVDRDRVISGLASLAGYGLFQHSSPAPSPSFLPSPPGDPHHARGHDDARGPPARRQADRGRDDARIRDRGHHPPARLSHRTRRR
jgi:Predicted divalent heavy-metal cations transporter